MNKQKKIPSKYGDTELLNVIGKLAKGENVTLSNVNGPKLTIKKFKGYHFGQYSYVAQNKNTENYLLATSAIFSKFIKTLYLEPIRMFDVDESIFITDPISDKKEITKEILKMSDNILKMISGEAFICRIKSHNHSFIMSVGDFGNNEISFITALFDNRKYTVKFNIDKKLDTDQIGLNDIELPNYIPIMTRYALCPFTMGKKERDSESILRDELSNESMYVMDDTTISLIYNSLMLMMSSIKKDDPLDIPDYTNAELYFIKKIFKMGETFDNSPKFYPFNLFSWNSEGKDLNQFEEFYIYDNLKNYIKDQDSEYPLIDFNRKEINFIIKYCRDAGYMVKGSDDTFNLRQYINESQYGDIFRYKLPGTDDLEMTLSCEFNDDKDILVIFISHDINKDVTVFASVGLDNISNFNIGKSYVNIDISILFKSADVFIPGKSDLLEMIPSMFTSGEDIADVVQMFIETFIVIHDRPKRSRMIKCTERRLISDHKSKKKSNSSDVIITRILKATDDAKEYVERMTASDNIEREYVLESWPRKGHYRRTSKDGEKVWIPPTVCKRHLPISDKEIHIKL